MLNSYFLICIEFFKIGLFTFGGGYASLPFLYEIIEKYNWFTNEQLTQLIAISGITPGPIGLNMATFAGFNTLGLKGALLASFALIVPMAIITSFVFKLYKKLSNNECMQSVMYILRPTSCALISAVGIRLFYDLVLKNSFNYAKFDLYALGLVAFLFILTFKLKRDPLIYILIACLIGIIIYFISN